MNDTVAAAAAFADAEGAQAWLAAQPRANAAAMLAALATQVEAFNHCRAVPRERFKALEVLRKAAFAIDEESRRRYEGKPLPLAAAERQAFAAVCRLWRAFTEAYLLCLRACMEGDPTIAAHGARVAHRVITCLRMEQVNHYAAGVEIAEGFWRTLHSLLLAAKKMGVADEEVEDPLPGETRESTVSGQHAMAVLLHLARPFSLAAAQLAAVTRWLARWREQAPLLAPGDVSATFCVPLDLASDRPLHDARATAAMPRWLSLDAVLRKIRKRREALAAGESPDSLKLGSALSAEACAALLDALDDALRNGAPDAGPQDGPPVEVSSGLLDLFRLFGGTGLEGGLDPKVADDGLAKEQLAVFGHVVRAEGKLPLRVEHWRLAGLARRRQFLIRPAGDGARLALRNLLAIKKDASHALFVISGLRERRDGSLCVEASLLATDPLPLVVEAREKTSGRMVYHPALRIDDHEDAAECEVVLPTGVPARASGLRFQDGRDHSPVALKLGECLARGSEAERWSAAHAGR